MVSRKPSKLWVLTQVSPLKLVQRRSLSSPAASCSMGRPVGVKRWALNQIPHGSARPSGPNRWRNRMSAWTVAVGVPVQLRAGDVTRNRAVSVTDCPACTARVGGLPGTCSVPEIVQPDQPPCGFTKLPTMSKPCDEPFAGGRAPTCRIVPGRRFASQKNASLVHVCAVCHVRATRSPAGSYLTSSEDPGGAYRVAVKAPVASAVAVIMLWALRLTIITADRGSTAPTVPVMAALPSTSASPTVILLASGGVVGKGTGIAVGVACGAISPSSTGAALARADVHTARAKSTVKMPTMLTVRIRLAEHEAPKHMRASYSK